MTTTAKINRQYNIGLASNAALYSYQASIKLAIDKAVVQVMNHLGLLDGHEYEGYIDAANRLQQHNVPAAEFVRYMYRAYRCLDNIDKR